LRRKTGMRTVCPTKCGLMFPIIGLPPVAPANVPGTVRTLGKVNEFRRD